jgi:hypothetical protein
MIVLRPLFRVLYDGHGTHCAGTIVLPKYGRYPTGMDPVQYPHRPDLSTSTAPTSSAFIFRAFACSLFFSLQVISLHSVFGLFCSLLHSVFMGVPSSIQVSVAAAVAFSFFYFHQSFLSTLYFLGLYLIPSTFKISINSTSSPSPVSFTLLYINFRTSPLFSHFHGSVLARHLFRSVLLDSVRCGGVLD